MWRQVPLGLSLFLCVCVCQCPYGRVSFPLLNVVVFFHFLNLKKKIKSYSVVLNIRSFLKKEMCLVLDSPCSSSFHWPYYFESFFILYISVCHSTYY